MAVYFGIGVYCGMAISFGMRVYFEMGVGQLGTECGTVNVRGGGFY